MLDILIRVYLMLSIIASFSPLPKNDNHVENCIMTNSTHDAIKLMKLGCQINEYSGQVIADKLEKCKNCDQVFCSLKPIYNNPLRKCFYANCAELGGCRKPQSCNDEMCRKAKYPFPTPRNILGKLKCTNKNFCVSQPPLRDFLRPGSVRDLLTNLFPNYNIITQRTSAAEVWIMIFTFVGILCLLKLTA